MGRVESSLAAAQNRVIERVNLLGDMKLPPIVCVDLPGCRLGSAQLPFLIDGAGPGQRLRQYSAPSGSVPVAWASDSTAGRRELWPPVKPVHSLAPLV